MAQKSIQKSTTKIGTLRDLVKSQKDQIALALPKHMTPDRLLRVSLTAISKTPKLAECNHASVLGSIISAAQLGFDTDGALGHAYLVPYKGVCQLIIGYRGMIDLARRSGQIISISARVVYENDKFDYSYGLEETLKHVPTMGVRGTPIGAYAVAKLKGGGYQFEVMSMEQIADARSASAFGSGGPWKDHWDEMARKTTVRRLFKYLPVSIEIQKAVGLDDMASAGVDQQNAMIIDIEPEPPETPLDNLTNKLKAGNSKGKSAKQQDPTVDPESGEVNTLLELQLLAKEKYGDKATEWIEYNAKCDIDRLTDKDIESLMGTLKNTKGESNGK